LKDMSPTGSITYLAVKTQLVVIIVVAYQLYLAISTEVVDEALKQVERVSSWPIQALNIGLFVLVLGICWLYLQSTRKDLAKLQASNEDERKEYIAALKTLVGDSTKIIERNNSLVDRLERRLERLESRDKSS
jgi:hypothetical protein